MNQAKLNRAVEHIVEAIESGTPLLCPRCGQTLILESIRVHRNGNVRFYHEHETPRGCALSTMERVGQP